MNQPRLPDPARVPMPPPAGDGAPLAKEGGRRSLRRRIDCVERAVTHENGAAVVTTKTAPRKNAGQVCDAQVTGGAARGQGS